MTRSVLLVEDDPAVAMVVRMTLEEIGYHVDWADRMDAALERFRAREYELVVTDFHIRQGSGRRLLNEIRKTHPALPVFLMTGTPFVDESDFAIYGFTQVFLKPFSKVAFCEAVRKIKDRADGGR